LDVFAKAFEDHDKSHSATTKIRVQWQGSHPASVYTLDFWLLACDIKWTEEAFMSQFYWRLWDDVKDLLLSMPDPQTPNEAISQVMKCGNRLFQRHQDLRSWNSPKHSYSQLATSTTILSSHSGTGDMQIDVV
jgi:hypothetical protein